MPELEGSEEDKDAAMKMIQEVSKESGQKLAALKNCKKKKQGAVSTGRSGTYWSVQLSWKAS